MAGASLSGCGLVADLGPPVQLEGPGRDASVEASTAAPDAPIGSAEASEDASSADAPLDSVAQVQANRVAVGASQACAIIGAGPGNPDEGTVRCWGANDSGQLGQDPAALAWSAQPLQLAGLSAPVGSLALGLGFGCAITTTSNYLYCWGNVSTGSGVSRQGAGPAYQPSVISVMNLGPTLLLAAAAAVGSGGGCTVGPLDPSIFCWGAFAPAGMPDAGFVSLDGGGVRGDTFESVVVGRAHACGIATRYGSRDVECWGANEHGQSGGAPTPRVSDPTPVGLASLGAVQEIAAGGDDTCALLASGGSGAVYCWGANDLGQLGASSDGGAPAAGPTQVPLPQGASHIAVGSGHACASNDNYIWCWGDDSVGQHGAGRTGSSSLATEVMRLSISSPVRPVGLTNVTQIAAGGRTTCALIFGSPYVWCWGANDRGQAGQAPTQAPTVDYATPVKW